MPFMPQPATLSIRPDGTVLAHCVIGPGVDVAVRIPRPVYARWLRLVASSPSPPALGRRMRSSVSGDLLQVGAEEYMIAGIFDSIAHAVSKVAKNSIVQNLAAGALALYGVPPGVTKATLNVSANLLDKAAAGHGPARQRARAIATAAAQGDPTAITAAHAVRHVALAQTRAAAAIATVQAASGGNPQARARLEQIAAAARRPNAPPAVRDAARAVQVAVTAIRQAPPPPTVARRGQGNAPPGAPPLPPVVRRAPPVTMALQPGQTRVISRDRLPDGRTRLTIDVAGG